MTAAATETLPRPPFEQIYVQHRKYVYMVCFRVLRNADDAEDVTQETFLNVWRQLPTFRWDCKITSWLYRIAVNESLQRKRKYRPDHISLDQPSLDEEGGVHFSEIAAPDHTLEMVLLVMDMERGMRHLAPSQREMLYMRIDGFSYVEIAEVLGASVAAARSNVFRGREKLRDVVQRPPHVEAQAEALG